MAASTATPEFAYGVTDWWEVGLYLPFAVQDRQLLSTPSSCGRWFVSPNAEQRNFFYGVNFEFSNSTPKFSQTRFGWRSAPSSVSARATTSSSSTPIVDIGFGKYGEADFNPGGTDWRKSSARISPSGSSTTPISGRSGIFKKLSEQAAHAVCRHRLQARRAQRR